jgi:hypothetical protein
MFKKKPICEMCGKNEATSFSFIWRDQEASEGDWKFVCECTASSVRYFIPISDFFSRPAATVDWLAHMHEKSWMDWRNFMEMMYRLRKATDS